jgi:hypothetical protein
MSEERREEIVLDQPRAITISAGASVSEIVVRAKLIDETYRRIMKRDVHYGVIPGTGNDKPTLLKAGAEKLASVFNLGAPNPVIDKIVLPEGHREYQVTLNIKHYPSGRLVGSGVGVCSTMESKYRYRNTADYEVTGEVIPRDYKERKSEYRKKGYVAKKVEGEWQWVKDGDSERSEHPDISDLYNTCLKMAKKRALIDGILTVTGASDIFTQDVEDFADLGEKPVVEVTTETKPQPKKYEVKSAEPWVGTIKDVEEKKLPDGRTYYVVSLEGYDGDKTCMTMSEELAQEVAKTEGVVKLSVRPGRKPNSWVLESVVSEDEGEAGAAVAA